ncbi:uncharacterized protein BXZ73DRAFT_105558 [Epithele typhae]|uniref:uncharacterized protein n=1 Tax=Epithele typhae TaxID=378194 RepID=UPI002008114A|nr:uncharacterized protein BXZ73DRAFT_105558 [Epithele typhae]KAH9917395.1 hypothetical protein BXZ73DRAFT_105558 [Epithele typhae]
MSHSFPLPTPSSLDLTIGAELVGLGVSLAFYGATTGQLFWYFRRLDGLSLRKWMVYYVLVLWLLGTMQVVISSCLVGRYVVVGRGNPAAIFGSTKVYAANAITSDFSSCMVRFGYFYRIWKFNQKRYLALIILGAVLTLLVTALTLFFGIGSARLDFLWQIPGAHLTWTFFLASAAQIVVDFMISFAVFASFLRFYSGVKRLDLLIRTIVIFALSTGSLNVLLSTCSIILPLIGREQFSVLPASYVFVATVWVFCQLEICSFLAVLNAEKELVHESLTHAQLARGTAGETIQFTTRLDPGFFTPCIRNFYCTLVFFFSLEFVALLTLLISTSVSTPRSRPFYDDPEPSVPHTSMPPPHTDLQ